MQTSPLATRFADKSGFLSVYSDGTNWYGIEPADLMQVTMPAGVTNDPQGVVKQVMGGGTTIAIGAKAVGLCVGSSAGIAGAAAGFTGGADQPGAFGTLRLHDSRVLWSDIETSQGVYDAIAVARLDAQVAAAVAKGMDVLYPMYSVPLWASGTSSRFNPPTNMTYVSNYVTWLLNRYGSKITHIEGWNEPNVSGSWLGTMAQLVAYQKAIYTAAKAAASPPLIVSPQCTFQSGIGLTITGVTNDALTLVGYLQAAQSDSGSSTNSYCDIIGYHPYAQQTNLQFDRGCVEQVILARNANAAGMPIWMTEIGAATTSLRSTEEMLAYCFGRSIARVIIYDWYLPGGANQHMDLRSIITPAQFDALATKYQGKTMQALNTYRTANNNAGGQPMTRGGRLGVVLGGVGSIV